MKKGTIDTKSWTLKRILQAFEYEFEESFSVCWLYEAIVKDELLCKIGAFPSFDDDCFMLKLKIANYKKSKKN